MMNAFILRSAGIRRDTGLSGPAEAARFARCECVVEALARRIRMCCFIPGQDRNHSPQKPLYICCHHAMPAQTVHTHTHIPLWGRTGRISEEYTISF